MILGFLERDSYILDDFLTCHKLEILLLTKQYEYEKIESYHPDYVDERVQIYKIWK